MMEHGYVKLFVLPAILWLCFCYLHFPSVVEEAYCRALPSCSSCCMWSSLLTVTLFQCISLATEHNKILGFCVDGDALGALSLGRSERAPVTDETFPVGARLEVSQPREGSRCDLWAARSAVTLRHQRPLSSASPCAQDAGSSAPAPGVQRRWALEARRGSSRVVSESENGKRARASSGRAGAGVCRVPRARLESRLPRSVPV